MFSRTFQDVPSFPNTIQAFANPITIIAAWKQMLKFNITTINLNMQPNLRERDMVLSSDKSSRYAKHSCHINLKSFYA